MHRIKRGIAAGGVFAACVFVAGCPGGGGAVLRVTPPSISFPGSGTEESIAIFDSAGGGGFTWTAREVQRNADDIWVRADTTFMTMESDAGTVVDSTTLTGSVTDEVDRIKVLIDRTDLRAGAMLPVFGVQISTSTGEERTIPISVTVLRTLVVTPLVQTIPENSSTATFTIRNTGPQQVSFEVFQVRDAARPEDLPTDPENSIVPFDSFLLEFDKNGSIAADGEFALVVPIDRDEAEAGNNKFFLYIDSNSGSAVLTITFGVGGSSLFEVTPRSITISVNIFGADQDTDREIEIRNPGEEPFTWSISFEDPEIEGVPISLPGFISVKPQSGDIPARVLPTDAAPADIVTIEVDPAGVPQVGSRSAKVNIVVTAEGVGSQAVNLLVSGTLGPRLSIQDEPFLTLSGLLDYGTEEDIRTLGIGNTGGVGTPLDFTFTTNRPDLIFLPKPAGGRSFGLACLPIDFLFCYDWQQFAIVIDREAMDQNAETDGGLITIEAPGQAPVEVAVTVTRAPLRIEGADNRARPPFINRFVFLLRDSLLKVIDTKNPDVLQNITFDLEEDDVPLDLDETNFFVNGPEGLKQDLVLLLDFTGSMYRAGEIDDVPNGQFIDEMKTAAAEFIDDLPDTYRIAIMEHHERDQTKREIHPFSTDDESLKAALSSFSLHPADHGETEIFDALRDAIIAISNQDTTQISFDEADVRSIVFVSDGNDTSSAAASSEILDLANTQRVRLYPIVFGDFVNLAPLVELGKESGGHTFNVIPPRTLSQFLGTEVKEGQIWHDLQRQLVLTYVSLLGASGTYDVTANVRDQTGATISGSFQRNAFVFPGDPRAGQVSLTTTGIDEDGAAEIFLRADYIPRNVSQFRVRFIVPLPFRDNVAPVGPDGVELIDSAADGGLMSGWHLIPEGDNVYTFVTEEETPLEFAAFGNLLRVPFTGLGASARFDVGFRVDNALYIDPDPNTTVDTNYFLYPGGFSNTSAVLSIEHESALAPPGASVASLQRTDFDPRADFAFDRDEDGISDFDDPAPDDDSVPAAVVTPELVSFPATETQKSFTIVNNRLDTFNWELVAQDSVFEMEFSESDGSLKPGETKMVVVTIDRIGLAPGTYNSEVSVFTSLSDEPDTLTVTVEVRL